MKTLLNYLKMTIIAVTLLLYSLPFQTSSQVITGGDFGITFTNGICVDVAPMVGYKYKMFSTGIAPIVMFNATGNTSGEFSYGGRIFVEFDVWKGILAHAEFEALNTASINTTTGFKQREWVMGAPIGVGYQVEITSGLYFKTLVLYDVLLDINLDQSSPKSNPSVRGGLTYAF